MIFACSKAHLHAARMYGVTTLYSIFDKSVLGAGGCPLLGITTEGAAVVAIF